MGAGSWERVRQRHAIGRAAFGPAMTNVAAPALDYLIRANGAFLGMARLWRSDLLGQGADRFRRELAGIFCGFENCGLPPLTAELFLLPAFRENWREERDRLSMDAHTHLWSRGISIP